MKINFILPGLIKIPVGGAKIIYRYAEELARLGHKVCIISPKREGNQIHHLIKAGTIIIRDYYHKVENKPYYKTPFGVEHYIVLLPIMKYIPEGDIIIATSWKTACWVNKLPLSKGEKIYFIQGMETWLGNSKRVLDTWKMPLKKIVISQWLKNTANKMGESAFGPVSNAIDSNDFFITNPIKDRQYNISMLYHRQPIKGANDGISALKIIKASNPNIQATIFSARQPFCTIPNWISLEIRPTIDRLREIYNSSALFLHPSHQEGWGLTPAESMLCGCAVVASSNEGIKEYIVHNKSGLLSPIGDVSAMVENIQYLLDNPKERVRIAKVGQEKINEFSWEKSVKQFEEILTRAI